MDKKAEIIQAKELRGAVVVCLYNFLGTKISLKTLKNQVKYIQSFCTEKAVSRAVYYLSGEGKNYVRVEVNEDEFMDSLAGLTPAGVNLVEGDIEDAGVILDE